MPYGVYARRLLFMLRYLIDAYYVTPAIISRFSLLIADAVAAYADAAARFATPYATTLFCCCCCCLRAAYDAFDFLYFCRRCRRYMPDAYCRRLILSARWFDY